MPTNNYGKLYIATLPTATTTTEQKFLSLNFINELKTNLSYKKEDRIYFHNYGDSTSITTGKSLNVSVSVDYDPNDELHNYLLKLITKPAYECNNQFIILEMQKNKNNHTDQVIQIKGKATFNFKNYMPSGNPDELIILSFDILPQDNSFEISETTQFNLTETATETDVTNTAKSTTDSSGS